MLKPMTSSDAMNAIAIQPTSLAGSRLFPGARARTSRERVKIRAYSMHGRLAVFPVVLIDFDQRCPDPATTASPPCYRRFHCITAIDREMAIRAEPMRWLVPAKATNRMSPK